MRNFIISDLHGNGYVYDSIMNYLYNELEYGNDDITLHIIGDLIDRGLDSGSMLVDMYERITNKEEFKIDYLGGNHELMMYNAYKDTKDLKDNEFLSEYISRACQRWKDRNMGYITTRYLQKFYSREEISKLIEFIGNLDVYRVLDNTMDDKKIILVHACACKAMEDNKTLRINDGTTVSETAVWARRSDFINYGFTTGVGNPNFFTVIGHTPVKYMPGYKYEELDNTLNIDGANSYFSYNNTMYLYSKKNPFQQIEDVIIPLEQYDEDIQETLNNYSHTPLVEVLDNKLRILTFNHTNEIIVGNYFESGVNTLINNNELNKYRKNLHTNEKAKQRVRKITKSFFE